MPDPTLVVASLSDEELKKSIDGLVRHVNEGAEEMKNSFDSAVEAMKKKLGELSTTKIDFGVGSAGGGKSQVKTQQEVTQAVNDTTKALNQQRMTYDQMSEAVQRAARGGNASIFATYDTQIELLKINLREAKQQVEAFTVMARRGGETGDKGLFVFSTTELHKYEAEVQKLQAQIDELTTRRQQLKEMLAPQGDAFKNYVDSLTRVNPELALLNQQYKSGVSLLQSQTTEAERLGNATKANTEEIRRQIDLIQNKKGATAAFEKISLLPQGSMEEIAEKGKLLQELINKVKDTPLMSQTNVRLAEKQLGSLVAQYRVLKQAKEVAAQTAASSPEAEEKTEALLEREKRSLDELKLRELERRLEIIKTGQAAAESANDVLAAIQKQQNEADYSKQIEGVKELSARMREMQRAVGVMEEGDPQKQLFQERIAVIREAIEVATRYNMVVAGIGGFGGQAATDTLAAYTAEAKRLAGIYSQLSTQERNASAGRGLIKKYQELERESAKLRVALSRPINMEAALKLPEKTLDDIAYKMRQLQSLKSGLDLQTQKESINDVNIELDRLRERQDKYMSNGQKMKTVNDALGRSWTYMKNRLAFYLSVGASTKFVKSLIEIRSQYEMNERALGILVDSAERGTQIFKELSEMSLVSPYTLIELSTAAKQLTAYDVAAKDVVETTRRLADMAAAVGAPVERLTYAFGQIKAYGYLNSRDARMFANAGIPLVKQLSEYYTELEGRMVSTADVYDRMKKKAIDYSDVMQVLNKMTDEGGKFFDFQAKMADTLKVRLANLTLAWNNMLNDIGRETQGFLTWGIGALKQLFLAWKTLDKAIYDVVYTLGVFKTAQFAILAFSGKLATINGWYKLLGKTITDFSIAAGRAFATLVTSPAAWTAALVYAGVSIVTHFNRVREAAIEMNKAVADGAKESAKALEGFLKEEAMVNAKALAAAKRLPESEAEKTWDAIREQLDTSAQSADVLTAQLLKIPDINDRISEAFTLAEKIQKANSMLSELSETALKVSQDSWANGLFGEGLAEDIEDYIEKYKEELEGKVYSDRVGGISTALLSRKVEAEAEMTKLADDLAEVLKDRLGKDVEDKEILREAVERLRVQIKNANPQIRGDVAKWFDVKLDELLSKRLGDAYDATTSLRKRYLQVLKADYSSTFSSITEDITKETARWNKGQLDAIKKAGEKLKEQLPNDFHEAIDRMLADMNNQDWRIEIAATMGIRQRTEFQRIYDQFYGLGSGAGINPLLRALRPKKDEDDPEYFDRLRKERKKNLEDIESFARREDAYAKRRVEELTKEAEMRKKILEDFKQPLEIDKKTGAKKDPLGDALKEQARLISELQKEYKDYIKDGINLDDARAKVSEHYAESLKKVGAQLKGFGIQGLTPEQVAAMTPEKVKKYYETILRYATSSQKGTEAIEGAIKSIDIEITKAQQKTYVESLDNKLSKLKDEYELAVALEADPSVGTAFLSMIGLNEKDLPHTVQQYADKATEYLNKYLGKNKAGFEIPNVLTITDAQLEEWREAASKDEFSKQWYDMIVKVVKTARDLWKKDAKETVDGWQKLLEKYAEFQVRMTAIEENAMKERQDLVDKFAGTAEQKSEMADLVSSWKIEQDPKKKEEFREKITELVEEVTGDKELALKVKLSIDTKEAQDKAHEEFEEFQKSASWITATGDLAGMTHKALSMLINDLKEYKKNAKNLSDKDIKKINKAISSLYRAQRSANPFTAIADTIAQARDRMADYERQIKELEAKNRSLLEIEKQGGEQGAKAAKKRKENEQEIIALKKEQAAVGKVAAQQVVEDVGKGVSAAKTAIGVFTDMADALGGKNMTKASKVIKDTFTVIDKAMAGAQIGSIGGGWGALAGAVIGGAMGVVTILADIISGNAEITDQVKSSEDIVSNLELAYKHLEREVEHAYGTARIGAQQLAKANKEMQLAELRRQLRLEESRKDKNRDEDKIRELKSEIIDLEHEIADVTEDIVNDLLGISSVGDAMETLMDSFVEALRSGEDAMQVFDESIDDMIANMIKKMFATKILQPWFDKVWKQIENEITQRSAATASAMAAIQQGVVLGNMADTNSRASMIEALRHLGVSDEQMAHEIRNAAMQIFGQAISLDVMDLEDAEDMVTGGVLRNLLEAKIAEMKQKYKELGEVFSEQTAVTTEDIERYAELLRSGRDSMEGAMDEINNLIKELDLMKDLDEDDNLSALQQGIQGITEDTAGALEAYMNSVSQQVYLHSDLLTQIRDTIQSFDYDLQTATMNEMLLQLQNSYMIQQSILSTMQSWSNPSGNAVKVELIN